MIDDLKWRVQNWLFARRNSKCQVERPWNIASCITCFHEQLYSLLQGT